MALDLILANERIVSRSRVWRILDAMEIQHLHASGGWKLLAVACRESMPGRGPTEIAGYSSFSLVRRGTFCVHRGALTTVADPLTLLEFRTGEEYRVSHPLGRGDDCIELACSEQTMDELHSGSGRCASPSTAWRLGNLARRARQGETSLNNATNLETASPGAVSRGLRGTSAVCVKSTRGSHEWISNHAAIPFALHAGGAFAYDGA